MLRTNIEEKNPNPCPKLNFDMLQIIISLCIIVIHGFAEISDNIIKISTYETHYFEFNVNQISKRYDRPVVPFSGIQLTLARSFYFHLVNSAVHFLFISKLIPKNNESSELGFISAPVSPAYYVPFPRWNSVIA